MFLHIVDSASHAGFGGLITWAAAAAGIAVGAFVVFGIPAIQGRRRSQEPADIADSDSPE